MRPPIFIVGSMRSGSTMLRLILDSHENIAIGPETGFVGALSATTVIPGWKYGGEWYERIGWSADELDERLREFYSGMFARYAASQGKTRWGDKTPFHTWHIAEMARVFPDAMFLGLVRHPGAVVSSLRARFHYDLAEAAKYWASINTELVRQGSLLGPRFVLCRYEGLVRAPEAVTRRLMGWLGEPWSPNLLEHHRIQPAKGAPPLVDGHTSTRDAVDASRATRWLDNTSAADLAELSRLCAGLPEFLGYEMDAPAALLEIGDVGTAGVPDGDDLAVRMKEWSERVDFSPPPPAVNPDASVEDLARRALRAEEALQRMRNRRVVRISDSLRRAQRNRSVKDLRDAVRILAGRDDRV
ncbi:MAG TPA: sulfotransferase [Actinomycetales bacterium]|nr:sulfotransferase [Actinomycetales bacterium]